MKKIRKPKPWKHPQPITKSQLIQLRDEFWDTAPHYGGRKGSTRQKYKISYYFLCELGFLIDEKGVEREWEKGVWVGGWGGVSGS